MSKKTQKIKLATHDFIYLVNIDSIIYCKSNNAYTTFFTNKEPQQITISSSLKKVQQLLGNTFLRAHQSYLVNTSFINGMSNGTATGQQLTLTTGQKIPVSTRRKKEVLQFFASATRIQAYM